MQLSRNTGYTIEQILDKPYELIKVMLRLNAELEIRDITNRAKYNAIASRIENKDDLLNFENLIKIVDEDDEQKQFDIRQLERIPGISFKKIKKVK